MPSCVALALAASAISCSARVCWRGAWPRAWPKSPGVRVLNEIVLNQVLLQFDGVAGGTADDATRAVIAGVQAEGTCWAGGAVWQGRQVMRISVSNWSTTEADIDRSADAILGCYRSLATDVRRLG